MADAAGATVTVRSLGADTLAHEVEAGALRFVADEPAAAGGGGEGPSPYELMLAALGACTAMTLRLYADRKGWGLAGVEVRLAHHRAHRADAASLAGAAHLDRIERELTLHGELSDGERARLLEIAEMCPVHRTLSGGVRIATRLR